MSILAQYINKQTSSQNVGFHGGNSERSAHISGGCPWPSLMFFFIYKLGIIIATSQGYCVRTEVKCSMKHSINAIIHIDIDDSNPDTT